VNGDSIEAGNVTEPAEAAEANAPAFEDAPPYRLGGDNLVERDALANPAQTEAPAQLAAGTGGIVTYTDTNAAL
jgi:hypothetical protein